MELTKRIRITSMTMNKMSVQILNKTLMIDLNIPRIHLIKKQYAILNIIKSYMFYFV